MADHRHFANLDDMRLNAHEIVGVYTEGTYEKVVANFMGNYMWKTCAADVFYENM